MMQLLNVGYRTHGFENGFKINAREHGQETVVSCLSTFAKYGLLIFGKHRWEFQGFPPLLGIHAREQFFNASLFCKGRFGKHGLVETIEQSIEA